jgi:hypothetical protein
MSQLGGVSEIQKRTVNYVPGTGEIGGDKLTSVPRGLRGRRSPPFQKTVLGSR